MFESKNWHDIDKRVLDNYTDFTLLEDGMLQYTDRRTNKTYIILDDNLESMLEREEKILHENDLIEKIAKRVVEILEEKHILWEL